MERHPGHELPLVGAEHPDGLSQVREHEQQPGLAVLHRLVEQHELVLPEHPLGEVAEHDPHLRRQHEPHPDFGRGLERADVPPRPLQDRVQQLAHRPDVGVDPLPPADALRRRKRTCGTKAGVLDDPHLGLGRERCQVDRRHARIAASGHQARDPLGDDPVDHVGIPSSSRSVCSDRAATTGVRRLAVPAQRVVTGHPVALDDRAH